MSQGVFGHTDRVTTVDTLLGFQDFFLYPAIRYLLKNKHYKQVWLCHKIRWWIKKKCRGGGSNGLCYKILLVNNDNQYLFNLSTHSFSHSLFRCIWQSVRKDARWHIPSYTDWPGFTEKSTTYHHQPGYELTGLLQRGK